VITSCDGWVTIPFQETMIDFETCNRYKFVDGRFGGVAEGVNRCW
jgi:hypothetical protein